MNGCHVQLIPNQVCVKPPGVDMRLEGYTLSYEIKIEYCVGTVEIKVK